MFEKEAKEYVSNLDECRTKDLMRDSFKDGAEFGYNKANEELEKENAELKEKLDKIRKYLVYDIFDRFKYLENLLKISQETQEELCKRIIEQQKTIGSLTDTIDEIKAYCKAVDEVNEKMKCCGNCKHEQDSNTDYYCEDCKRFANETDIEKNGRRRM